MSGELIRPHDPFSGHTDPDEVLEAVEPEEATQEATPVPEPAPVEKAPAKKRAPRRGRRTRVVPTKAEVEAAARAVKP